MGKQYNKIQKRRRRLRYLKKRKGVHTRSESSAKPSKAAESAASE